MKGKGFKDSRAQGFKGEEAEIRPFPSLDPSTP
jgi:hypothetical protein